MRSAALGVLLVGFVLSAAPSRCMAKKPQRRAVPARTQLHVKSDPDKASHVGNWVKNWRLVAHSLNLVLASYSWRYITYPIFVARMEALRNHTPPPAPGSFAAYWNDHANSISHGYLFSLFSELCVNSCLPRIARAVSRRRGEESRLARFLTSLQSGKRRVMASFALSNAAMLMLEGSQWMPRPWGDADVGDMPLWFVANLAYHSVMGLGEFAASEARKRVGD